MSKIKSKTKYNDCWMYILLLSSIVILTDSVQFFNIKLFNVEITIAIFLIPLIYAVTNYITKKYGFKRTLNAIIISTISLILFIMLMNFAIGKEVNYSNIIGSLLGYIMSQVVNTFIYKFLLVNTNSPYILILLNYIFAYIVYYMIYTVVYLDRIVLDNFWISYFLVLLIQTIMSIVLAIIDKKIPIGMSKDD